MTDTEESTEGFLTEEVVKKFVLQVVGAAGPEGMTEPEMDAALIEFTNMWINASMLDLWSNDKLTASWSEDRGLVFRRTDGSED